MPSTINDRTGDLVLVDFPYTTSGPGKPRPALVILDTGDADAVLARVATQAQHTPFDVVISDWRQAGLLAPSTARLHKLATLDKGRVRRHLGSLTAGDRQQVAAALRSIADAW